jgi:hypothetical protein
MPAQPDAASESSGSQRQRSARLDLSLSGHQISQKSILSAAGVRHKHFLEIAAWKLDCEKTVVQINAGG